jgi:hypothetical protein
MRIHFIGKQLLPYRKASPSIHNSDLHQQSSKYPEGVMASKYPIFTCKIDNRQQHQPTHNADYCPDRMDHQLSLALLCQPEQPQRSRRLRRWLIKLPTGRLCGQEQQWLQKRTASQHQSPVRSGGDIMWRWCASGGGCTFSHGFGHGHGLAPLTNRVE